MYQIRHHNLPKKHSWTVVRGNSVVLIITHYLRWRRFGAFLVATFCTVCVVLVASEARAQCSARDAQQNLLTFKKTSPAVAPPTLVALATAVPVWKTITIGRTTSSFALRNALDAAGCGIGDLAEEILARPAFTLTSTKMDVDFVVLSAAELGVSTDTTSLADLYARAQYRGLVLAPAEVGPLLRLQYFDQPIGEVLHVGMKPISIWRGDPAIFVLVNGGAGLILIGQNGSANVEIPATSRFLFVRPRALAKEP
jgi:hypothetical protein